MIRAKYSILHGLRILSEEYSTRPKNFESFTGDIDIPILTGVMTLP